MFYYKYNLDEERKIRRLFWADSRCRADYENYGDVLVLVFDTKYRTNYYKKPFFVLCGVNIHFMTCVFPCALLSDETCDTYEWVLIALLDTMG